MEQKNLHNSSASVAEGQTPPPRMPPTLHSKRVPLKEIRVPLGRRNWHEVGGPKLQLPIPAVSLVKVVLEPPRDGPSSPFSPLEFGLNSPQFPEGTCPCHHLPPPM